jgi:hypothetical protein
VGQVVAGLVANEPEHVVEYVIENEPEHVVGDLSCWLKCRVTLTTESWRPGSGCWIDDRVKQPMNLTNEFDHDDRD